MTCSIDSVEGETSSPGLKPGIKRSRGDRSEDLEDIKVEFQGNRSLKTDSDLESLSVTATMDAAKAIRK